VNEKMMERHSFSITSAMADPNRDTNGNSGILRECMKILTSPHGGLIGIRNILPWNSRRYYHEVPSLLTRMVTEEVKSLYCHCVARMVDEDC
jgi:hypothetical protein